MAKTTKKVTRQVLDEGAQITMHEAITAFHAIYRLSVCIIAELPRASGDANSFCMAITDISQLHGKALDDCVTRVTGHPGVGCFDKEFIDHEEASGG